MPTPPISEATQRWCEDRDHPFVTYNPWLDRSYCRCGQRQEPGDQPQDEDAKRSIFHDCQPDETCRCYMSEKTAIGPRPVAAPPEQVSLFDEPDEVAPQRRAARTRSLRGRSIADLELPA